MPRPTPIIVPGGLSSQMETSQVNLGLGKVLPLFQQILKDREAERQRKQQTEALRSFLPDKKVKALEGMGALFPLEGERQADETSIQQPSTEDATRLMNVLGLAGTKGQEGVADLIFGGGERSISDALAETGDERFKGLRPRTEELLRADPRAADPTWTPSPADIERTRNAGNLEEVELAKMQGAGLVTEKAKAQLNVPYTTAQLKNIIDTTTGEPAGVGLTPQDAIDNPDRYQVVTAALEAKKLAEQPLIRTLEEYRRLIPQALGDVRTLSDRFWKTPSVVKRGLSQEKPFIRIQALGVTLGLFVRFMGDRGNLAQQEQQRVADKGLPKIGFFPDTMQGALEKINTVQEVIFGIPPEELEAGWKEFKGELDAGRIDPNRFDPNNIFGADPQTEVSSFFGD